MIVDAGVGTASDVTLAMELGCDGVLLNTGIAGAHDPLRMAHAMRQAIEAGRLAALAGRIPRKLYATASSPLEGRHRPGDLIRRIRLNLINRTTQSRSRSKGTCGAGAVMSPG